MKRPSLLDKFPELRGVEGELGAREGVCREGGVVGASPTIVGVAPTSSGAPQEAQKRLVSGMEAEQALHFIVGAVV